MTENKMVKIPYYDGTIRLVPSGTPIEFKTDMSDKTFLRYAFEHGYGFIDTFFDKIAWKDDPTAVVVAAYVKSDDSDITEVVKAPEGIGAVIHTSNDTYLTRISDTEWRSESGFRWSNSDVVAYLLTGKGKVVHKGYEQ